MTDNQRYNRRAFLAAAGLGVVGATAGCLDFGDDTTETPRGNNTNSTNDTPSETPDVPDIAAPDDPIVYRPSHVDGREMVGMKQSGPYGMSLMYTIPHDFWVLAGQDTEYVPLQENQSMHIMAAVWEPEYGHLLPTGNPDITIEDASGAELDSRSLWSMLSQEMGPHFGDNLAFPDVGEYTVTIDVDPVSTRQLGEYVDTFNTAESATFTFEFSFETMTNLPTQYLDNSGSPGALPPISMDGRPTGAVPDADALPGTHAGTQKSGDADFVVQVLETAPAGIDSTDPYLAVSPRTPYNKYPLPFMGLRATVDSTTETLPAALHPELGYHYGAAFTNLSPDSTIMLEVGSPPQISRHRGYQQAFLQFDDMEFSRE